jgi:hypothetical protein
MHVARVGMYLHITIYLFIFTRHAWSYTSAPQYVFMAWRLIKKEIHLHIVLK